MVPAAGVRNGRVVNIVQVAKAIRLAVDMAEKSADVALPPVILGVSGNHLASRNIGGFVVIPHGVVTENDINRLREVALPKLENRDKIIHVLPLEFDVDDTRSCLQNPVGMIGKKLSGDFHVITAAENHVDSLTSACRQAGVEIKGMAASSLAGVEAVLNPEEIEQGVLLVDCGCDVTDMAFCFQKNVFRIDGLDYGLGRAEKKIGQALCTPVKEVERILAGPYRRKSEKLQVKKYGPHGHHLVSRRAVTDLLRIELVAYLREIDGVIDRSMSRNILFMGAVLTGGGALMPEIRAIAELVLDMPVQVRGPQRIVGKADNPDSPAWSTAIGLAMMGGSGRHAM